MRARRSLLPVARHVPLLAAALFMAGAAAASEAPLSLAIKANYLHKFAPYVTWPPPRAAAPLTICIIGPDPFGELLGRAVAGQRVDGRPLVVRRLDTLHPGSGCRIAYLRGSPQQSVAAAVEAVEGRPVLTITDAVSGEPQRGIIHFEISGERVRFHIDEAMAARNGLSVNSKLLGLALTVRTRGQ